MHGRQNIKFDCKKLKNVEGKLADKCMIFLKSLTNKLMQILRMYAHTSGSEYGDKKDNDKILNEAFGHSAVLYFKHADNFETYR